MVIDELKSGWGPKNFHPTQPTNISNKHINTLGQRLRLAIGRRGWSAAALGEDFVVELVLDDSIVGFNSGLLDRGGTVGGWTVLQVRHCFLDGNPARKRGFSLRLGLRVGLPIHPALKLIILRL